MAKENIISIDKEAESNFDWLTAILAILLVIIGLISIFSATYDSNMHSFFYKQLFAAGLGTVLMFGIAFIPKVWLQTGSYLAYFFSVLLLGAVFFIGIESHGTQGWIRLGGFSIQPSEIAKVGLLLFLARHLSLKRSDVRTFRDIGIVLATVSIPLYLIFKQPDVGSASVIIAMLLGILFWSGFNVFFLYFIVSLPVIMILSLKGQVYFITAVAVLSAIAVAFRRKISVTVLAIGIFIAAGYFSPIVFKNLAPHQQARIETFLNPGSDPRGTGYNVIQSLLAVGSGGITGKGYLQGTQTQLRYIPMQWTDFIFSVPTEEFGFIGGSIVIILLTWLILRAIKIAYDTENKFYSLLCAGAATIILYHFLINIGMAIGLMPVMGIPLPFLSYGGTSMIINMTLVGFLLNAYRYTKMKRKS